MTDVVPGTPCWADLAAPDLEAAKRFYSELFGWKARASPQPEAGGYTQFLKDGKAVAAAGPPATDGQPGIWSTYLATDDAEAVTDRVEAAGGNVLVGPFDVLDQGRMAVFSDPAGAAFCVWQPLAMRGAELFGVPGALSWNELITPDPEGARNFYELVFGWQPEEQPIGPVVYTRWRLGDRIVAGMMPTLDDRWPTELPAYWSVYFGAASADETARRATELGGAVMVPPQNVPQGRVVALRDPQGALFSVVAR